MDNILIYLIQSFNCDAFEIIFNKYLKLSKIWANDFVKMSGYFTFDYDILENDLINNLYHVIENYDSSKGVFYSYVKTAVYFTVKNFLREITKNNINTCSLESEVEDDLYLIDVLSSEDNMSKIVERYYVLEEVEEILNKIDLLKEEDKYVVRLKMQGYSVDEISRMTEFNLRKVNYILAKFKKM